MPRPPNPDAKPRRSPGEGSVYQRQSDNLWCASLTYTDPHTGAKKRKTFTSVESKAKAVAKRAAFKRDLAKGVNAQTRTRFTLGEYLTERWLPTVTPHLRGATLVNYESTLRLHIAPLLGATDLVALDAPHLRRFYDALAHIPGVAERAHVMLHKALKDAVRWGYLARNVADLVDGPHRPHVERTCPTPDQVRALFNAAAARRDRCLALYMLLAYSGARPSEVLGLTWEDIDMANATVSISKTRPTNRDPRLVEPTKTAKSRRLVSIPAELVEVLRQHRTVQMTRRLAVGAAWQDTNLVFANRVGGPLYWSTISIAFRAVLAAANVPPFRPYDLRHFHATYLLAQGIDLFDVSRRLGHATIAITANVYAHRVLQRDRAAADAIGTVLGNPNQAQSEVV